MKALIRHVCAPKSKRAAYEAEDIHIVVELPFMPVAGMRLKLTPEGEFNQVDEVFWDVSLPDEVEVFLEEPDDLQALKFMLAEGWRLG